MNAIGHNLPPASVAFSMHIDELFNSANGVTTIETDEQEELVADLLSEIRTAQKDGDASRAAEKKPHMDAAKAVDDEWREPLRKAVIATDALKASLTPYREARQRAKDAAAAKARAEAEAAQKAAQDALRASDDLEDRFAAEERLKHASKLIATANRIDRSATGLRTFWEAEITDPRAALNHYIKRSPERFEALIQQLADEDARGARAPVPGIAFHERRRAA